MTPERTDVTARPRPAAPRDYLYEPASIPEVTGVGGTTLNEAGGNYWSATNDGYHASALSNIPETAWNDSVSDGTPEASTGGASYYFTKPSWQNGPGVPADGFRDVPDVAMPASADHDAYMVYTSGLMLAYGGTSVSSPVFAGVTGLLNQYLIANGLQKSAGQGNLNPRLYALAQASPGAFHDITSGDNMVPSLVHRRRTAAFRRRSGLARVPVTIRRQDSGRWMSTI